MTNQQLYLAIGIPAALFALNVLTILWQARAIERTLSERIGALEKIMLAKFETAHEQLLRVEGVLDARLKHVEERLPR